MTGPENGGTPTVRISNTLPDLHAGVSGRCFAFAIGLLGVLVIGFQILHYLYSTEMEVYQWFIRLSGGDGMLHRSGTLYHAVAMMLLTGVVLVAPVLSLSLHQFHDKVYDAYFNDCTTPALKATILNYFEEIQELYGWRNDLYLATWAVSIAFLFTVPISFCFNLSSLDVMFLESIFYLISAMLLCSCFALVSFAFFVGIRPGETKLKLYVSVMKGCNHE